MPIFAPWSMGASVTVAAKEIGERLLSAQDVEAGYRFRRERHVSAVIMDRSVPHAGGGSRSKRLSDSESVTTGSIRAIPRSISPTFTRWKAKWAILPDSRE
jgi:hypothetical protein